MQRILTPCLLILALCLGSSCSRQKFDYPIHGADEFVTDSYRIAQGKFSILEMEGQYIEDFPHDALNEYRDTIDEDDILNVVVYHPTRKDLIDTINYINNSMGFRVKNGKVNIPDIPDIQVAGLSLDEARAALEAEYQKQIQDIELFVTYRDRLSRKVDRIAGMAATHSYPVDGKVRLYEVLAKVGIPPTANWHKSYVMRDGKQLPIDLYQLINQGDLSRNIVMRGGDKIFVAKPDDSRAIVMGEVGLPSPVDMPYGFVSLREALVRARGIPYTGDKSKIQVIRGNLTQPKVYLLSWEHIVNLPNRSLLLMPGDTVFVAEKPITKWNRFISQLMPSVHSLQATYGTYRLINPQN